MYSRVTFIKLTEKGRELKPVFDEVSEQLNAVVYRNLTEEGINSLEENIASIL